MRQDRGVSMPDDPRPVLAAAEHDVAEADRLGRLAASLREQVAVAQREVESAQRILGVESADVARLERLSFARVWASLRGDTAERIEKERGEEQAARYRLEVASEQHRAVLEQAREAEERKARLGDVAARRAEARERVESWVLTHGGPTADALTETLRRVALLEAEQREVQEAAAAADAVLTPLTEATRLLEAASGWSTYDLLGGGMVTDLVKRDRMNAAAEQLRAADQALRYLSAELSDLGQRAAYEVMLPGGLDAFDLWFDDIFSSWAVHNRIGDAQAKVADTQQAVIDVSQRLTAQARELATALARAEEQRAGILRG
jgi:hypothetical protein